MYLRGNRNHAQQHFSRGASLRRRFDELGDLEENHAP